MGIGVSPGVARGAARVVRDPAKPSALEPGDVLVAPITDPAWTPLFLVASAVVVEVGANLSHAAIVARELGIPAVVSVERATEQLADGTPVEVDGTRGSPSAEGPSHVPRRHLPGQSCQPAGARGSGAYAQ